ncbi:MAG: hypothetical protein Ct9H300mP21_07360 [Pseudomonadota bacterium]|nr:MAG: hypothetical protein Ct9H300mP21_07360 [Pseudomonadota bacterium]
MANYKLFLLQLFLRFCLFVILFTLFLAGVRKGVLKLLIPLIFPGKGPLFLSDKQIQEDLVRQNACCKKTMSVTPFLSRKVSTGNRPLRT